MKKISELTHDELVSIAERVEKRMNEAKPNATIPREKLVWTGEVFSVLLWELERILSGED